MESPRRFLTVTPAFFLMAFFTGAGGSGGIQRTLLWMAVVFVSVLVHECGHALAARAFGHAPWIVLHGMGGTTYWKRLETTRAFPHILISLAGPFAGFALGALVVFSAQLTHWHLDSPALLQLYRDALWANFGWGVVNLLPIVPLDGGQVLQTALGALFGPRAARGALYASTVVAGLIAAVALYARDYFIAMLAGYFAMRNVAALRAPVAPTTAAAPMRSYSSAPPQKPAAPVVAPDAVEATRGALARGDGETAERLAKSLIAAAPNAAERSYPATLLSYAYLAQGRLREARAIAETMITPPGDDFLIGRLMLAAGELEPGTERMRRAFDKAPSESNGYWLVYALIWQKRLAELADALGGPGADLLNQETLFDASAALFYGGHFESSLDASKRLFTKWERADGAYNAACACSRLGRLDDGVAWLGRAIDAGWKDANALDEDEDLEALRAHALFGALRARLAKAGGGVSPTPAS